MEKNHSKKYVLIKEYPGSPKLGTIVMNGIIGVYEVNPHSSFDGSRRLRDIEIPEKYPEFWEEIVERGYEILSFIGKVEKNIFSKNRDGLFTDDIIIPSTEEEMLSPSRTNLIHSVRRRSDGVVFTVGDKIKNNPIDEGFVIEYIWINDSDKIVLANYDKGGRGTRSAYLQWAQKIKQPLFTTEDGVDIYEGDEFYCITVPNNFEVIKRIGGDGLAYNEEPVRKRCFSTEEAAEEHIILNKPCLSILDIAPIIGRANEVNRIDLNKLTKDLMEKVKTYM